MAKIDIVAKITNDDFHKEITLTSDDAGYSDVLIDTLMHSEKNGTLDGWVDLRVTDKDGHNISGQVTLNAQIASADFSD